MTQNEKKELFQIVRSESACKKEIADLQARVTALEKDQVADAALLKSMLASYCLRNKSAVEQGDSITDQCVDCNLQPSKHEGGI